VLGNVLKGRLIGVGGTGIVDLMPDGLAIKTASTGIGPPEINRSELWKEAAVYARLGAHPRPLKIYTYNEMSAELSMVYMENGDLDRYLATHNAAITYEQRLQWIVQLFQVLCYIHNFGILHTDLTPRNMLLDGRLELKICDFASCSVDGYRPSGIAGSRYTTPSCSTRNFNLQEEIHVLGSTIYHISTGQAPYAEFDSDQVRAFYSQGEYPDTSALLLDKIIRQCWSGDLKTAEQVFSATTTLLKTESCPLHESLCEQMGATTIARIGHSVHEGAAKF
jgi:serine/threonine protein kinase